MHLTSESPFIWVYNQTLPTKPNLSEWLFLTSESLFPPLEFFFQEQSYSSLHSGRSSAWDHVRGDIDDPCGAIADFCGVNADPCGCGVVAIPEAIDGRAVTDAATPIVARLAKHHKTLLNIVKHHETHLKHCKTS